MIEVRAHDTAGLLYRLVSAIAECRAVVRSAVVGTLGAEAVDVSHLVDSHGKQLPEDTVDGLVTTIYATLLLPPDDHRGRAAPSADERSLRGGGPRRCSGEATTVRASSRRFYHRRDRVGWRVGGWRTGSRTARLAGPVGHSSQSPWHWR